MAGYKKRQFSKSSTAYIALGVVLIAVMTIAGTSAFMKTNGFIVTGASAYTAEEVVEASGISIGDNLLFINSQAASQSIREALPFISSVEITRRLPDTVNIVITESIAVAYIHFAGDYYIIDSSGRVLDRSRNSEAAMSMITDKKLIEIRGVEIEETVIGRNLRPVFGTETKLQYMQDVLIGLEREGLQGDVTYLDVSNIVNVHFEFMKKFTVIFRGTTNLRPNNLRHSLSNLAGDVVKVEQQFPHSPGEIIFDETGQARFYPKH